MQSNKRDNAAATSHLRGGSGLQITPVTVKAAPDPKKFGRGKRTTNSAFGAVTVVDSESDDEIMVVSEKITPKTKMRLKMKHQRRAGLSLGPPLVQGSGGTRGRGRGRGRPQTITRPTVTTTVIKKPEPPKVAADPFEDDDDLTCRVCLSAFWYKTQILEHLEKAHSVKDPESFLKDKKRRL